MRPTVFIVDDDVSARESLQCLMDTVGLHSEVYETPEQFLDAYRPSGPGCLILDLRLPGMSGLELQRRLKSQHVSLPIIFVTGYGDVRAAVQAMERGAINFLEKPYSEQRLLDLIQKALESNVRDITRRQSTARARKLFARLTAREREVVEHLAQGRSSKMIAAELNISKKTADLHRSHVMKKLQVRSLAELVRLVLLLEEEQEEQEERV